MTTERVDHVPVEREWRFLVADPAVIELAVAPPARIMQAYLWASGGWAIRVRKTQMTRDGATVDGPATVTLKGPRIEAARVEYEWPVDAGTAESLYEIAQFRVLKQRYEVVDDAGHWEIDHFLGDNDGLIIAEFEAAEPPSGRPSWLGEEITHLREYDNEELARNPIAQRPT